MYEIRTEIEIAATPERVWSILLGFRSHPEWNPFIRRIKGAAKVGARLTISIQPKGGKGMTFRPVVRAIVPNQELRWLGRFLIPGLFDGEHYFQLQQLQQNGVLFVHGEKFSGLFVRFAQSSLDSGTKAGFIAMNEALKARAESPAHQDGPTLRG